MSELDPRRSPPASHVSAPTNTSTFYSDHQKGRSHTSRLFYRNGTFKRCSRKVPTLLQGQGSLKLEVLPNSGVSELKDCGPGTTVALAVSGFSTINEAITGEFREVCLGIGVATFDAKARRVWPRPL